MKKISGFTLIEIVIVIAIIGLLGSVITVGLRGVAKKQNLNSAQLPKYERLSYGVAKNSILISPSTSIDQLKLLISDLPKTLCSNPKVCLINIYDDAVAAKTDTELTDEFLNFAEKHFIGQYSSYGGANGAPVSRYKVNGQWTNF